MSAPRLHILEGKFASHDGSIVSYKLDITIDRTFVDCDLKLDDERYGHYIINTFPYVTTLYLPIVTSKPQPPGVFAGGRDLLFFNDHKLRMNIKTCECGKFKYLSLGYFTCDGSTVWLSHCKFDNTTFKEMN